MSSVVTAPELINSVQSERNCDRTASPRRLTLEASQVTLKRLQIFMTFPSIKDGLQRRWERRDAARDSEAGGAARRLEASLAAFSDLPGSFLLPRNDSPRHVPTPASATGFSPTSCWRPGLPVSDQLSPPGGNVLFSHQITVNNHVLR